MLSEGLEYIDYTNPIADGFKKYVVQSDIPSFLSGKRVAIVAAPVRPMTWTATTRPAACISWRRMRNSATPRRTTTVDARWRSIRGCHQGSNRNRSDLFLTPFYLVIMWKIIHEMSFCFRGSSFNLDLIITCSQWWSLIFQCWMKWPTVGITVVMSYDHKCHNVGGVSLPHWY